MRRKPATATSAAARAQGPAYPVAQFIEKPPLDVAHAIRRIRRLFLEQRHVRVQGRAAIWPNSPHSRPDILEASHGGVRGGQDGFGFRAHRQGGIREMPQRVDRLCGDGENPRRRGAAARCRLERRGFLVLAVRCAAGGRGGQCAAGRCHGARHPRLLRALDQPPGRGRGHGRSHHRRDQGCRSWWRPRTACRT